MFSQIVALVGMVSIVCLFARLGRNEIDLFTKMLAELKLINRNMQSWEKKDLAKHDQEHNDLHEIHRRRAATKTPRAPFNDMGEFSKAIFPKHLGEFKLVETQSQFRKVEPSS